MSLAIPKIVHANPVYGSYFADPFVWTPDDPRCEGPTWGTNFLTEQKPL